jgi:phosphoadenosine phosphosulfate reductase
VDSGYNLPDCYQTADQLTRGLKLNLQVYTPSMTAERRTALEGGIPTLDEADRHRRFTHDVKLEPFQRALSEHRPKVWISGIRKTETEHRQSLDIVSMDARGILKVAPLFHWSEAQLEAYMREHNLPSCKHYFDPTKVIAGRECGLHTAA